jgi:broad specificity phosphatase PhoE
MKITLIRHGEVESAFQHCYNGHNNISLSKKGEQEALLLGKEFEKESFDLVYCSDLQRTKETIKYFVQEREAIYTASLREKSWGRDEGMSFGAIIKERNLKYENFSQWIDALDGEDYKEFIQRIKVFFLEYLFKQDAKNILIITHAGVIRVLISIVKEISLEKAFSITIPYGKYMILDTQTMNFSQVK